jgi:hypothetical protein
MMDKDVMVLGLTDLLLCWSTGFCLVLQRVVLKILAPYAAIGSPIIGSKPEQHQGHPHPEENEKAMEITISQTSRVRNGNSGSRT